MYHLFWRICVIMIMVCGAVFFPASRALSAAWTQPHGQWEVVSSVFLFRSDEFFDEDGNSTPQGEFTKIEFNPYIEYGLFPWLTVGASPTVQYLEQDSATGNSDNMGIGDIELFARYALWQDDWSVFSLQPLIKIPGPYDDADRPQLGSEQVDLELRGLYGHSLVYGGMYHFINIEGAYRHRVGDPGDEVRFDTTLGIRPIPDFMVLGQVFTTFAVDEMVRSEMRLTNSEDFNLVKLQLSGVQEISPDLSVQLGGFHHVWAQNTGGGSGVVFSIWKKF